LRFAPTCLLWPSPWPHTRLVCSFCAWRRSCRGAAVAHEHVGPEEGAVNRNAHTVGRRPVHVRQPGEVHPPFAAVDWFRPVHARGRGETFHHGRAQDERQCAAVQTRSGPRCVPTPHHHGQAAREQPADSPSLEVWLISAVRRHRGEANRRGTWSRRILCLERAQRRRHRADRTSFVAIRSRRHRVMPWRSLDEAHIFSSPLRPWPAASGCTMLHGAPLGALGSGVWLPCLQLSGCLDALPVAVDCVAWHRYTIQVSRRCPTVHPCPGHP
jgi:hypothetical protein